MPRRHKPVSEKTRKAVADLRATVDRADAQLDPAAGLRSATHTVSPERVAPTQESPAKFDQVPPGQPNVHAAADVSVRRGPGRPPKPRSEENEAPLPEILLNEEQCAYLLEMVGSFNTAWVSLCFRMPPTKAGEIWKFSKGELDMLAPPATKVINKHAPEWLRKYADEFALAVVLLPILTAKMGATIAARYTAKRTVEEITEKAKAATQGGAPKPNSSAGAPHLVPVNAEASL